MPGSFRLIRELVDFLSELEKDEYRDVRWVVEEVLSIVNGLDLPAIHEDLSFRQRKAISRKVRAADEEEHRLFERDPFIYFYEDYLKAYDPAMRKGRGVYYTPPPIVNFIVRAVDDILKESFGIRDGLADHNRVTVLDFACGTGTFLLEVFQRIFDNIGGPDAGRADLIVREHILRNIFGFEYLIAPYTIAHLKLSQYLKDQKHPLNERRAAAGFSDQHAGADRAAQESPLACCDRGGGGGADGQRKADSGHHRQSALFRTLEEQGRVDHCGDRRVQVHMGKGQRVDRMKNATWGAKSQWLQDDYVKFIRFAQMKMDGFTYQTSAPIEKPSARGQASRTALSASLPITLGSTIRRSGACASR